MSERLRRALRGTHSQIENALRATQPELDDLKTQVRELELLMQQARNILDLAGIWVPWPPLRGPTRPITLHEAIRIVLRDNRNRWMMTSHIAREVGRQGLYRRRDGLPPTVADVSARISGYPALFRRDGWLVCLRTERPGTEI
jgi:hypothetical protein